MTGSPEPAGLYLHIPFCSAICPYCDFAVTVGRPPARSEFVARMSREIDLWADWSEPFDTVYLGGGTPSLLGAELLASILDAVRAGLPVAPAARVFMEANPEDVNAESVRAWRGLGVEVVSLGVQAFDDAALRFLGRRHDAAAAREAVSRCVDAGFRTTSVDVIFGLPGQAAEAVEATVAELAALRPDHVSAYQLTVHDGTPFASRRTRGALVELDEHAQGAHYLRLRDALAVHGFVAYEASNFARGSEHRSRHNRKYWRHVPYLGIGPSAHAFDGRRRWWNLRRVEAWSAAIDAGRKPVDSGETLGRDELALERVMLGLRTVEGIDLERLRADCALDLVALNQDLIDMLDGHGLIRLESGHLMPTATGMAVADGLAARFRVS